MALPPLAPVDALEAWLGVTLTGVALDRAAAVLDAASAMVRAEAGLDWTTTTTSDDDEVVVTLDEDIPADVVSIAVRIAANMWANPSGATQQSTGPFSVTHGAALTETDRTLLGRFRAHGGLFTISTTRGDLETDSVYVDVVGTDEPLPVGPPW